VVLHARYTPEPHQARPDFSGGGRHLGGLNWAGAGAATLASLRP
jgi:hypothetical protein